MRSWKPMLAMFTVGSGFAMAVSAFSRWVLTSGSHMAYKVRKVLFKSPWVDWNFRLRSARILPLSVWNRLRMVGFEYDESDEILGRILSLADWGNEWTQIGLTYLHRAYQRATTSQDRSYALLKAAMAFHISQLYGKYDPVQRHRIRWYAERLFAEGARHLDPAPQAWQFQLKPGVVVRGYYRKPAQPPRGLILLSNGLNFCKEEMHFYAERFLRAHYAVLYYDDPVPANFEDVGTCLLEQGRILGRILRHVGRRHPEVGQLPLGLWGLSLGAWKVLKMATESERTRACIALSPLYEPLAFFDDLLPQVLEQFQILYRIDFLTREREQMFRSWLTQASLKPLVGRIRCPTFIVGGGNDTVVPSTEALRVYQELRCPKRLFFDPDGAHMGMDRIFELWPKFIHFFHRHLA